MKKVNIPILLLLFFSGVSFLQAQNTRYVDPIFSEVDKVSDVVYGTNISVLTGMPAPLDLKMDVYSPADDDATDRPVVLYFHTGSFLPGFVVMALFSLLMLAVMRKMQLRWTRTWAEKGGRARSA